jgi:hypothetical protein
VEAVHAYVIEREPHEPDTLERMASWLAEWVCIPAERLAD